MSALGPVSVVIPVKDGAASLPAAVGSALAQPEVDEVVVAVGPSSDGTADVARDLSTRTEQVRVVENPSGTTPQALNLAWRAASGDVIVRLDAHAVLPPGYVGRALETLERTGAANVGGRQDPVADRGFARAAAAAMRSRVGAGGAAYRVGSQEGPVDTVYLGVFRRDALEAVGGFDETMIRNQDAELNLRLRRAGMTVWFDPELAVAYRPRGSAAGLARQYLQYGRWRRLTARLHPGSLRLRQLLPPVALVAGVSLLVLAVALGQPVVVLAPALAYLLVVTADLVGTGTPLAVVPGAVLAVTIMHLSWSLGFLIGPPREAVVAARERG